MAKNKSLFTSAKTLEIALIIQPQLSSSRSTVVVRSLEDQIQEIQGLARAISLDVQGVETIKVSKIQAGFYFQKGGREKVAKIAEELKPSVIIVNSALSPVQQRNLEKDWNAKVIDRTALILEIFGARAQTKEGRLQVELAALEYQKSRLVRSWTHLERQRGSTGFIGGPGETQIEIDRRLIRERITKLKKELENVRRTRNLSKKNRERVPFPVVALVGYTNAGKSTLFNRLTHANVLAEDQVFATLDPTMRQIDLAYGEKAILSDTVGFISDLPTQLIEAFRATLEQIDEADVIIHVIDVSRNDYQIQKEDVIKVLEDLGIGYDEDKRIIELYNKSDSLNSEQLLEIKRKVKLSQNKVLCSAVTGEGTDILLKTVQNILNQSYLSKELVFSYPESQKYSWLYDHANILEKKEEAEKLTLTVRISSQNWNKYKKRFCS